ncbi:acetylornithine deacetylase [Paraburkholderia sediminicola]|uniref:acetylornithine deacetylase n=1 Tax=Paraburkholderia sediminicola TaxID=458836 RepID=UPI0038B95EC2
MNTTNDSTNESAGPDSWQSGLQPAVISPSIEWTKKLISFNTTSRLPNLALIETVRDYLKTLDIQATLTSGSDRKWANLFATLPAYDGHTTGGIVLSGHTDVVPVDGQEWNTNPFFAEVKGSNLFGRGSCDMKGFIGSVLALVPHIRASQLAKPIHIALSFDEEIGCLGAPLMIADIQKHGVKPEGCIVGEPTSMRPVIGHKGINVYRCCVRGHAAHSSLTPKGLNSIEYAARLICRVREIADRLRSSGPFDAYFDVPFSTAQTSKIVGGNSVNTVPSSCEFEFEFRNLPTESPNEIINEIKKYAQEVLLPQMRSEHPTAAIDISALAVAPSFNAHEEAEITRLVRTLTVSNGKKKVAYGTEAGLFEHAGIPTIICGPGDITNAHKANEFVALSQIDACDAFLEALVDNLTEVKQYGENK